MSAEPRELSVKLTDKELQASIEALVESSGALEAMASVIESIDPPTRQALEGYKNTLDFLAGAFLAERMGRRGTLSQVLGPRLLLLRPIEVSAVVEYGSAAEHPQADEARGRVFDEWPEMLWNSSGSPPHVVAPADGSEPTPVLRDANKALREWADLADRLLRDAQVLAREVDRLKGSS